MITSSFNTALVGWDDPRAKDRLAPALVNDALALLRASARRATHPISRHPY